MLELLIRIVLQSTIFLLGVIIMLIGSAIKAQKKSSLSKQLEDSRPVT
jgi:septal ring-binding cell division protein DamX